LKETYLKRCFTVKKKNKTLFDISENLQTIHSGKIINKLMKSGQGGREYHLNPFCMGINSDVSVFL